MALITAYDGITIQLVGELYTSDDSTRRLHPRALNTYLRALSDLAFGIVLSEQIVLARAYPRYATTGQAPGYDLHIRLLRLNDSIFARKTPPEKSEVALAQPGESVPADIARAAQRSVEDERQLWRDFVHRELTTYFPASDHYMHCDIGLDDRKVADLFGDLQQQFSHVASPERFVAFVKGCLGSHILGDYKTSTLDWNLSGHVIRLPHATRADVHLERIGALEAERAAQKVKRWIAPQVLGHALVRPQQTPTEFFEELLELREKEPFKDIREKLTTGVAEWEERHSSSGLDALADKVEAVGRTREVKPFATDYVAPGVLENAEFLSDVFAFRWPEVCESLKLVFPTLREEGGVDKSVHLGDGTGAIVSTGDGVVITNNVIAFQKWIVGNTDVSEKLITELAALRDRVGKEPPSLERDETLGTLAQAEKAARSGKWDQVTAGLKNGGKKLLELATQFGLEVAAKAIAKSLEP